MTDDPEPAAVTAQAQPTTFMPDEEVQKILLSTPARFVGELVHPDLLLTHAWPPLFRGRRDWLLHQDSPIGRTAIVMAFRTPPYEKVSGAAVPNYEGAGLVVASVLSVVFGKRFDAHGPMEMSGRFGVPDMTLFGAAVDPTLNHTNGRPRANHPIPLHLGEARRCINLIVDASENPAAKTFHGAAAFYRRALQAADTDPEVAYLHLITAGEILSGATPFDEERHLDLEVRQLLQRIAAETTDGPRAARLLLGRLRGVKKRFVDTIASLVDDTFFDRNESAHGFGAWTQSDFERRIAAAYDLRSQHVHTGYEFGLWVGADRERADLQIGTPIVPDQEMSKLLARAPLFAGLERVIRYCILNFGAKLGLDLDRLEQADGEAIEPPTAASEHKQAD